MPRIALVCVVLILCGCRPPAPPLRSVAPLPVDFARPLPPGTLALRKLPPDQVPSFAKAAAAFNRPAVLAAIGNSLRYLATPSSRAAFPYADITHDRALATLKALRQLLATDTDGPAFDAAIRSGFDVYQSIGGADAAGHYGGQVQFTGYCTPIYPASRVRGGAFQWPLYRRPADLVNLDANGDRVARRLSTGTTTPGYYTRREIEDGGVLAGHEYVWLADRFDAYVVTVQGSARLRLPDGSPLDVGYAGNNGRPYASPGRQMVADGLFAPGQLNLAAMRSYFAAHPDAMDHYLPLNARTVFFTDRPGGPFGKLNVPVTAFGTIATDKSVYPRAMPAFLTVDLPSPAGGNAPFQGFMCDQDAGGAIRAAGRADIYMGVGPEAERLSGRELATGKLYYLAVR